MSVTKGIAVMYDFNPMTSLGLLQNMNRSSGPLSDDAAAIANDAERHIQPRPSHTFATLLRRVIHRISAKRPAA